MGADNSDPFSVLRSVGGEGDLAGTTIKRALQAVRSHLGMQVAYVSEFVGERTYFREIDAPGLEGVINIGDSMPLDDVYCRHILEGRLPELIPDTAEIPLAAAMPLTQAMGIRAHLSVPIGLSDGRTFGMFCCLSTQPEPSLNTRDLKMMRAFADMTALQISRDLEALDRRQSMVARIRRIMDANELSIVNQPIVRLTDDRVVGFECLSRFSGPEKLTPDIWFGQAASVGMGVELETAAVRKALAALDFLPGDLFITLNVSPETIVSDELPAVLKGRSANRIILELTEHALVHDYARLHSALARLRRRGARLAIDDAGAGYSSLRHILDLRPDIIKLDISLTRNINGDPARSALAAALVHFARATGSRILAEGVETASELEALRALGVEFVQGYHLGRPAPLSVAMDMVAARTKPRAQQVA